MATYLIKPPARIDEIDAGRVKQFLENNGITVESVSVMQTREGVLTYQVECDTDPSTLIDSYVKPKNLAEQARDILTELKPKLIDGTATTVEMRRALAALVVLQDI